MRSMGLRSIERNSWKLLQQDGLMDALFGVLFLAAAVVAVLDQTTVADWVRIATLVTIQFGGVIAMIWMRWRYVAPRLGRVKYAQQRTKKMRPLRTLLAICVAITVALVALTALSNRLGLTLLGDMGGVGVWLLVTAIVFVPIGAIAYFLEHPRLLLYAGLLSGAEFFHIVVNSPSRTPYGGAYTYGLASVIAFAVGIPIYVRFLRRYPRAEVNAEGVGNES